MCVDYGLVIRNPAGQILIDNQRKMPKLHTQGRVHVATEGYDEVLGWYYYAFLDFPATKKPVFATAAVDETVVTGSRMWLRAPVLIRNSQGAYHRVRVESRFPLYAFVWVYFL